MSLIALILQVDFLEASVFFRRHQAMLVSEELIRVAILWHELWHEGLEEASRLYFGERNIKGDDLREELYSV